MWEGEALPEALNSRCDIPRVDASKLSFSEFRDTYMANMAPVLLANATKGWLAGHAWSSPQELTKRYGSLPVFVGQRPPHMLNVKSMDEFLRYMASNASRLDREPLYLWDDALLQTTLNGNLTRRHPIEDTSVLGHIASLPQKQADLEVTSASFTIGPACSGSPFHQHDYALNALLHGTKYWLLSPLTAANSIPVEVTRGAQIHPRRLLEELAAERTGGGTGGGWWLNKTNGIQECVQHAGEALFLPAGHFHAVLNLWPSVAANIEFQLRGELSTHHDEL